MTTENKVSEGDLNKAISALQDLAKGHSSRGTNTTAVESMSGVGGSTQVHHTASNSDPGTWAGTGQRPAGDNGAKDSISENGTDFQASAEMVKSILDKLSKGVPLTAQEYNVVKGLPPFMKKDDDKDDDKDDKKDKVAKAADDKEDKDDMDKSLADFAAEEPSVAAGMEISPFLSDYVTTMSKSLAAAEKRIVRQVLTAISEAQAQSDSFNKSLAGALGALGEGLVAQTQRVDQIEQTPARGPKSVTAIEKSFAGNSDEQLTKSMVASTLSTLVEKGLVSAQEVVRFESVGQISEETMAKVRSHRSGK